MEIKTINKNLPLWQLSVAEFLDILSEKFLEFAPPPPRNVNLEGTSQWEYGIDGIAKIFHCSRATAMKIKKSGVIAPAIKQIGRKIVVDVDLALKLAEKKGGRIV